MDVNDAEHNQVFPGLSRKRHFVSHVSLLKAFSSHRSVLASDLWNSRGWRQGKPLAKKEARNERILISDRFFKLGDVAPQSDFSFDDRMDWSLLSQSDSCKVALSALAIWCMVTRRY